MTKRAVSGPTRYKRSTAYETTSSYMTVPRPAKRSSATEAGGGETYENCGGSGETGYEDETKGGTVPGDDGMRVADDN